MSFIDIPDVLSINGNRIVIRKYFEDFHRHGKKSIKQRSNEKNLKNNSPKGIVTRKIKLKIKAIVVNWIEALKHCPTASNTYKKYLPTFVTLTLPSKQQHTDKELHRSALARFIQTLKRSHKIVNYLWRAEKQDNGNIHYHIIIDKFISYRCIKSYWNKIMNDLGYIAAYRKNQNEHHKNGFKPHNELLKNWPLQKQKQAYLKGISTNWNEPNTTDIHSLKNIKNVADYICKYVTKADEFEELQSFEKAINTEQISAIEAEKIKETIRAKIEKKKIDGRIWGCSDEIKNLKDPKIIVDYTTHNFINEVLQNEHSKVITDDNFTIAYNRQLKTFINNNSFIKEQYNSHHYSNFTYLYPEFKPQPKIKQQELQEWQQLKKYEPTITKQTEQILIEF
jgi:hypothetical protein